MISAEISSGSIVYFLSRSEPSLNSSVTVTFEAVATSDESYVYVAVLKYAPTLPPAATAFEISLASCVSVFTKPLNLHASAASVVPS